MAIIMQSLRKFPQNISPFKHFCGFNVFTQKASYAENAAEAATSTEDSQFEAEKLKRIRNISRLNERNYNKLHGIGDPTPYDHHHRTLRWHRKQVGVYGTNCGIDPALCFITKEEMEDLKEYEKVAFNKSIEQIRKEALQKEADEKEERRLREERVAENLLKVQSWKQEIRNRMQQKETEAIAAKAKREKLLEDVRRHFGYMIDTRDEKFQIMLELKEQEMKKQAKMEKKKKKEEYFMKKLASLEAKPSTSSETTKDGKANKEVE